MKLEKYADILSRAIENPTDEEKRLRQRTDHGWLTNEDFKLLVKRRIPPLLETQVHAATMPNGEIWFMFPDGTKQLCFDKDGNDVVNAERIPQ